jgi:hypothetical protein
MIPSLSTAIQTILFQSYTTNSISCEQTTLQLSCDQNAFCVAAPAGSNLHYTPDYHGNRKEGDETSFGLIPRTVRTYRL